VRPDQTELIVNEKYPCLSLQYRQTKGRINVFVIAVIFIQTHEVDQSLGGQYDVGK
jgi:hypothetical protein